MKSGILGWILMVATSASSMESALFLDTQSRIGYQWTVQSWLRTGLVAPFINFRSAAFGMETGLITYLSINDGGPTTAPTNIYVYKYAGNWLGSDLYIGRTFRF